MTATHLGAALAVPLITAFARRQEIDAALRAIFAPQEVPEAYADRFGVGLALRRRSLRLNARQLTSLKPYLAEMSERYGTLDLPVEVVHGTADAIVPLSVHSEPLVRAVPGAVLTRLEGIGHMPHHVAAEATAAAVFRAAERAGML